MKEIKVSIIIPVYNAEKYLHECLESICSQTYNNIEILCVDDGSTDMSAEIIKTFQKEDKRIVLIQQTNQYAGVARNNGFDAAKGEYVVFLDADDYFAQTLVEKMVSAIYNAQADIAVCKSRGFDEKRQKEHELKGALHTELLPEKKVFSKRDIPEHIFQLTAGWAWDKMYRAGFLREKKLRFQEIRAAEDELFVDLAFGEAESIIAVHETLVTHRTNVISSLEYRRDCLWHCGFEMLTAEKEELKRRGLFPMLERSFVNRAATYITWNACSITNPVFFSEFYAYFREKAMKRFGFARYSPECYDDSFVYETIRKMAHCSEKEFLCSRIQELNQTVEDRDFYVQDILSDAKWMMERLRWMDKGKRWTIPENRILQESKVILYGYGDVGKDWYEEIQKSDNIELVMVVDRNYQEFKENTVRVQPPKAIETAEYDYILIAINEREIAEAVMASFVEQGVMQDKILWFDPAERVAGLIQ